MRQMRWTGQEKPDCVRWALVLEGYETLAMDETQFDHLTRSLTDRHSRRSLGQWAGVAAAALGIVTVNASNVDAKKKKKGKKGNKGKKCTPNCSGRNCGSDGCGGTCGSCTSTQVCSNSGQCLCAPTQRVCPAGSETSCCDSILACCPNGTGQNGCCPPSYNCCPMNSIRPNGGCCGTNSVCATTKAACCPGSNPQGCAGTNDCCRGDQTCCSAGTGAGCCQGTGSTCCAETAHSGEPFCCPSVNPVCASDSINASYCCPAGSIGDGNGGCTSVAGRGGRGVENPQATHSSQRDAGAKDSPQAT